MLCKGTKLGIVATVSYYVGDGQHFPDIALGSLVILLKVEVKQLFGVQMQSAFEVIEKSLVLRSVHSSQQMGLGSVLLHELA